MKNYSLFTLVIFIACCSPSTPPVLTVDEALEEITVSEYRNHLATLSSDEMNGRDTGSPGYDSAALYVERLIQDWGLSPGGENGTYRQPVTFTRAVIQPEEISVSLNGNELEHGTDFLMRAAQKDVDFSGKVVFVGAGIDAPDMNYSDFDNIDVDGKVVMYVRRTAPDSFGSIERAVHSNLVIDELKRRGAIGYVVIVTPQYLSRVSWPLLTYYLSRPSLRYVNKEDDSYLGGIYISYQMVENLMKKEGKNLADIFNQIKEGNSPSFETDITLSVKANSKVETIVSDNVAGVVEGTDPDLKNEYLVVSAHLDHTGVGNPVEGDSIYNGTIDNASGSSAILVLANKFARMQPKRSMLFLWVTGEERGLLGSEYFAKFPTIDASQIVANQNMDVVTNLIAGVSDVIAFGYEHSNLSKSVDYAVGKIGLDRTEDPKPEENFFIRSDQYSFVAEGFPAIWTRGGYNSLVDSVDAIEVHDYWRDNRYHKPSDDMEQPLNLEAAMAELKCNFLIAHHIANELPEVKWDTSGFLYKTFVKD